MNDSNHLEGALSAALPRIVPGATTVADLHRLSGGASQETWAFDAATPDGPVPLILRRGRLTTKDQSVGPGKPTLATEAHVIRLAREAGALAPNVRYITQGGDGIGPGYVMDRVAGETIARKILRDDAFARARPNLARQCGEAIAKVHSVPVASLPPLRSLPARTQLDEYRATYDAYDYPHPVFEHAFKWLESRVVDTPELRLVHGDFRNGNIIVDENGLAAILDWEIVHLGDPMEDLGWICVNSWRFGEIDKPVGGFGEREDLFAGYETSSGRNVDPERVRFWETFGSLKWGIMCMTMYDIYKRGADTSVERAAIGRRSSETEIDLLRLIEELSNKSFLRRQE